MKKIIVYLLIMAFLGGFFQACEKEAVKEDPQSEMNLKTTNSSRIGYIVVLNDADAEAELAGIQGYEKRQEVMMEVSKRVLSRAGVIDGEIDHVYGNSIKGFSVKIPPGQLQKLQDDPGVKYVEKDQIVTFVKPDVGDVTVTAAQETPYGIARVGGGAAYTFGGRAWIIDTGIDLDHPDLNVDQSLGISFDPRAATPNDDNGHGSHVAGIIAAVNNLEGVVGVAAGATVIPVKVLNRRGSGAYSVIIEGVDYVAGLAEDGDVANMSLGGPAYQPLDDAVVAASSKCKFALAAGNDRDDANLYSPARANGPNVYTVSGCDINDNWYYYSNYSNPPVDYCEPGVAVLSTYKNGGYATLTGTSMAAPHLAGILLWGDVATDGTVKNEFGGDGTPDPIGVVGNIVIDKGGLAGTVTDGENSLSGVFIEIEGTGFSTLTDVDGSYSINDIPVGNYDVNASKTGYSSDNANIDIQKDLTITQNFTLGIIQTPDISLDATASKVRGWRTVDLSWTGNIGNVDIYRNGVLIVEGIDVNSYQDVLGRTSGTFTYRVCETGGTLSCSDDVTITI